ncbi:uncharacterized protein LOC141632033 [Silene latifolia]|uniref:uncharacterized protein LOC141632033 n=1 Tax=Silene latifolia TaxID=37657 RepID=UPI003D76FD70
MEILSRSLRTLCLQPLVSYHPKCSQLGLTHLIFADDLMVFVRGDVPSVLAVQQALASFASISGLHANVDKTQIYFGGVVQEVRDAILISTGFSEGSFPFRYLGLPLGTSRYSVSMYDSLLLKIQTKLQHWSAKSLTYAGKAQLLDAVIFGIENYWCSSVLLPKQVLHQINHFSRNFFWGIKEGDRKMQFKSWHTICAPWHKGGFNIKNVQIWNIALLINWIWKFSNSSNSLWVKWHKKYVLKTDTIWSLPSKDQFSSSFKGILAARSIFLLKTGSPQAAEAMLNSWVAGGKLLIRKIYEFLLDVPQQEDWFSVFFHQSIVPSHRVTALLAAQRKLATIDNLQQRGFQLASRCSLCKQDLDTHQHLLVWSDLIQWQHLTLHNLDLLDLMHWSYGSQHGWAAAWFRTTLAAATYGIWIERNRRIFLDHESTVQAVVNKIKYTVAVRLYMSPRFSNFVSQLSA